MALAQQLFHQPPHVRRFAGATHPQIPHVDERNGKGFRFFPARVIQPIPNGHYPGVYPGERQQK